MFGVHHFRIIYIHIYKYIQITIHNIECECEFSVNICDSAISKYYLIDIGSMCDNGLHWLRQYDYCDLCSDVFIGDNDTGHNNAIEFAYEFNA